MPTSTSSRNLAFLCNKIATTDKVRDVNISPDGSSVVYQVQPFYKTGRTLSQLWTARVDVADSAQLLTDRSFNDREAVFHPTGDSILFLSDRHNPGRGSTIFQIGFKDGEIIGGPKQLLDVHITGFEISPNGDLLAFVMKEARKRASNECDAKVFGPGPTDEATSQWAIYSFESRQVKVLESTRTGGHIEFCCWNPDGKQLLYRLRLGRSVEFTEMTVDLLKITVDSDEVPELVGVYPRSPSGPNIWGTTGQISVLQSYIPSNILDARTLFIQGQAPSGLTTIAKLYGETEDATRIVNAATQVKCWGDYIAVEVCSGVDTHIDVVSLHPTAKIEATIFQTQGDAIWFGAWDARRLVQADGQISYVFAGVLSSGDKHEPPNVWTTTSLGSSKGFFPGRRLKLSSHLSWLADAPSMRTEVVHWETRDGVRLSGIANYTGVESGGTGPRPTVLFLHGGPYRRVIPDYMPYFCNWRELLAWAGYLVISPNYRGSQGHGHDFAHSARLGIGQVDWPDCESMVDEMVRRGQADPTRLAVAGWSHGASLAAWGVTTTKNRFKAAIVGAGVTNWEGMVLESESPELEAAIGQSSPWETSQTSKQTRKLSPVHQVEGVETAVLIIHGEKDDRVPVGQAIGFWRGLRRFANEQAKETVQLVIYPREPHGFVEQAHAEDVLKRVLSFLEERL